MLFFISVLIFIMLLSILYITKNHIQSKTIYERKITTLENLIVELTHKLKYQEDKVKLSDDLKNSMNESKKVLSDKILDMNHLMFEELFNKKA